jgi:hypothetical protein
VKETTKHAAALKDQPRRPVLMSRTCKRVRYRRTDRVVTAAVHARALTSSSLALMFFTTHILRLCQSADESRLGH